MKKIVAIFVLILNISFSPLLFAQKKHNLEGKKITQLQVSFIEANLTYMLGSSFQMIIKATTDDGNELTTTGAGKGKTKWENYKIEVDGGIFVDGILTVNNDAKSIKNHKVLFKVKVASDTSVAKIIEIPLINNLQISYEVNSIISLGSSVPLNIKAIADKDKSITIKAKENSVLNWKDFIVQVDGGIFVDGNIIVNKNYKEISNHTILIKASLAADTSVKTEIAMPLKYNKSIILDYSGKNGKKGEQGVDGVAGIPASATSGAKGGNGTNGENALDGEQGGNGIDVDVYVKAIKSVALGKDLLYIKVFDSIFIVDPTVAKITILSNGGNGGTGGTGGKGGSGGLGATFNNASNVYGVLHGGDGGDGGNGGDGGSGGNGGDAGVISIFIDPSATQYKEIISTSSIGGSAGLIGFGGSGGNSGQGGRGTTACIVNDAQGSVRYPEGKQGVTGSGGSKGLSGSQTAKTGKNGAETKLIIQEVNFN